MQDMAKAFENIRVLDLSDRLSGAWAARLFGNFGADVILVEDEQGHPLRHEPPFLNDEPGDRELSPAWIRKFEQAFCFVQTSRELARLNRDLQR